MRLDENDMAALWQLHVKGPYLNFALRNDHDALRNDMFGIASLVSMLDAAFRKVSFPEERIVYRGVPDGMFSGLCPGDQLVDPAFMSESLRREVALYFGRSVLEVMIPAGGNAIYLCHISIPCHLEVLINRGSTLSIEEVDMAARTARATLQTEKWVKTLAPA